MKMMFEMDSNPLGHFLAGSLYTWHLISLLFFPVPFLLVFYFLFVFLFSFLFFSFFEHEESKKKRKIAKVCAII